MEGLTQAMVPGIAKALVPFVEAIDTARAEVAVAKDRWLPVYREVLARHNLKHARTGEPIADPDRAWLAHEDATAAFHADLDRKRLELDATTRPGYCPILVAECRVIQAETALIREACSRIPGLKVATVLASSKRAEALALFEKMTRDLAMRRAFALAADVAVKRPTRSRRAPRARGA